MSVNNGYLIPADPSPPDNRCVRIYVPNDPLYMAALLGTLTFLGQWTAWERDELHRGATAAARWKDANDLTLDGLSLPCGDNPITDDEMSEILEQLAEINRQLLELNEMNITVTQTAGGCGCGCGDGTTTTTTTTTPIISPEETGIIPVYNTDPIVVVDSIKCRSANYLAAKVSYMIRGLDSLGDAGVTIAGIITLLVTIVTWLTPIPGDEVLATSALIFYAMMIANTLRTADDFAFSIFGDLADELDANMESFVCSLYGWNSSSELGNSLSSFINAKIDQIQPSTGMSNETATALKTVLNSFIGAEIINWFVDHVSSIVPADFTPMYDCTCGAQGDTCPTQNVVLAGYGTFPAMLDGIEYWTSEFNGQTGYHEIVFELADNWCVGIEYYLADFTPITPETEHKTCSGGVMVDSDGSCIRRFVARSLAPFVTAVDFIESTIDCNCIPRGAVAFDELFTFAADLEGWTDGGSRSGWQDLDGGRLWWNPRTSQGESGINAEEKMLLNRVGYPIGSTLYLDALETDLYEVDNDGKTVDLIITDANAVEHTLPLSVGGNSEGGYFLTAGDGSGHMFNLMGRHNGSDSAAHEIYTGSIRVRGWYIAP